MRVFLPRFGHPDVDVMADIFVELARHSILHEITEDLRAADIALFTQAHAHPGWPTEEVFGHPAFKHLPGRCFVYDERDMPWCALPGLYVSMPSRSFDTRYQRAAPYAWLSDRELRSRRTTEPTLLFSFVGSTTHKVRSEILRLQHPRARLEDTGHFVFYDRSSPDYGSRRKFFLDTLSQSKFVLCPRGHGSSSIRLFETIAAGRVPVVISDSWHPPAGLAWQGFCLFVPECEVREIPAYLVDKEKLFPEMAARSSEQFDTYLSQRVRFDYMIGQIEELLPHAWHFPTRGVRNMQYARVLARQSKARLQRVTASRRSAQSRPECS